MALYQSRRGHHLPRAVTAAVALCVLLASGCTVRPTGNGDRATSDDGLLIELGDVRLSDVAVLTAARGHIGSSQPAEVTIGLAGADATTVHVRPGGVVELSPRDQRVPITAVPADPGATVDLDITSRRHGSTTVAVPVHDAALPRFAGLVPGPTSDEHPTGGQTARTTTVPAPQTGGSTDPAPGNVIHAPPAGAQVAGPDVVVEGVATAFEGNLLWQTISEETSRIIASGLTTGGANGTLGPFRFTVTLEPGTYTIEIWEPAMAEDGAAGGATAGPTGLMRTTFTVV
jgi:hypothetical protein